VAIKWFLFLSIALIIYYQDENFEPSVGQCKLPRLYHLCMNYITWEAISLSLLNPESEKYISKICNEGKFERDALRADFDTRQKLHEYVLIRPQQFFLVLSNDKNLKASNINPTLFITQALFQMWTGITNGDRRCYLSF